MNTPETSPSPAQIECMISAMYAVAAIDGTQPQEAAMIDAFLAECRAADPSLGKADALKRDGLPGEAELKEFFTTPESKQVYLTTLITLAYADGNYSAAEKGAIASQASVLGITGEALACIEQSVHDRLMGQFADITNIEALQEVAKATKPS